MAGMSYALYRACSLIMLSLTAVVYGDPAICTLLKTLVVKSVKRKMTAIIVFFYYFRVIKNWPKASLFLHTRELKER